MNHEAASNRSRTKAGTETRSKSSLARKFKVWLISEAGYWVMRLVGSTLHWKIVGWEHHEAIKNEGRQIIYAFWHGRIFAGTYFFRNRGIVVMTSQNKDGDYIARTIRRFGYQAARGSSSRGGSRALAEMIRQLKRNSSVAFTMDGPRGPRYVAKPGAIWLASKSGNPILPFSLSAKNKWVFSSWDQFQFPKPFSRVLLLIGPPQYVKPDATGEELAQAQLCLQNELDRLVQCGDSFWDREKSRT
jgi:lysophospholipid acyltransferase (LPLAT)-like uncharacterized protein